MGKPFDIAWVRSEFPALALEVGGQPRVFLDGPAGTQVPARVIRAMVRYLESANANTGGAFETSRRTDAMLAEAHAAMADLLGCAADEVWFGPNMTTMTFALARAIGRTMKFGDEILVTGLDHDANVAPWRMLEERGVIVRQAAVRREQCTLDLDDLAGRIGPRTRLVAVGWAANAVGTISDVATLAPLCRKVGAWLFVDAVHYAPHGFIDVKAIGCDFLACSPYKFFAPHLGALYGRRELLKSLVPDKVRPASEDLPHRWETGTQNHEGLAGLVAAIEYLEDLGRRSEPWQTDDAGEGPEDGRASLEADGVPPVPGDPEPASPRRLRLAAAYRAIRAWEMGLMERLIPGLLDVPGLTLYGIGDPARFDERVPTVAFRLEGIQPRVVAERLAERGVFVWAGHFYALELVRALRLDADGGLLRAGFVHYNTPAEADRLVGELRRIARGES